MLGKCVLLFPELLKTRLTAQLLSKTNALLLSKIRHGRFLSFVEKVCVYFESPRFLLSTCPVLAETDAFICHTVKPFPSFKRLANLNTNKRFVSEPCWFKSCSCLIIDDPTAVNNRWRNKQKVKTHVTTIGFSTLSTCSCFVLKLKRNIQ